ncbi:MAG: aminopeptidase [Desulfurococcales archaeon]|nr:aminopeptidase [Desulfurococcales archaeon]
MYSIASGIASSMVSCLGLGKGDRIMVFHDAGSREVYKILASASEIIMAEVVGVDIDRLGRPLKELPGPLRDYIDSERPSASFYVAGVKPGELGFRAGLIEALTSAGARHVHMPKATPEILSKASNCMQVAEVTRRLHGELRGEDLIVAESPGGTKLKVEVGGYRWVPDTGIIGRGEWGNWPPGEVYTTPVNVNGVLAVDGVLGDYFSMKYGLLGGVRARLVIEDGYIVDWSGDLSGELIEYLKRHECGVRIGEVGIGSNIFIKEPIGNMLHDEKIPGIHIAAGDPLGDRTGAEWSCPVHVDMMPLRASVWAGEKLLVNNGVLTL